MAWDLQSDLISYSEFCYLKPLLDKELGVYFLKWRFQRLGLSFCIGKCNFYSGTMISSCSIGAQHKNHKSWVTFQWHNVSSLCCPVWSWSPRHKQSCLSVPCAETTVMCYRIQLSVIALEAKLHSSDNEFRQAGDHPLTWLSGWVWEHHTLPCLYRMPDSNTLQNSYLLSTKCQQNPPLIMTYLGGWGDISFLCTHTSLCICVYLCLSLCGHHKNFILYERKN